MFLGLNPACGLGALKVCTTNPLTEFVGYQNIHSSFAALCNCFCKETLVFLPAFRSKRLPQGLRGSRFLENMKSHLRKKGAKQGSTMAAGQMTLDLEAHQVDPLGSWFGSKAAQVFITANGAAGMS
jgi:hypothetical protein